MVKELAKNVYCIPLEFPKAGGMGINCYLIKGERSLLIDTGPSDASCEESLMGALEELEVVPEAMDMFITHYHWDHCGLVRKLKRPGTKVYVGEFSENTPECYRNVDFPLFLRSLKRWGVMDPDFAPMLKRGYGFENLGFELKLRKEAIALPDNAQLCYGGYKLQCIQTPGHCDDHFSLYEPENKLLFCGDLILANSTPVVAEHDPRQRNLAKYLASLRRVTELEVNKVCPGHGPEFYIKERALHIMNNRVARLDNIVETMGDGSYTVAQIAPIMTWRGDPEAWNKFGFGDKLMAISDAHAHITYLCEIGILRSFLGEEGYRYYCKNR